MPNRLIKESICTSDTINELTWFQEVCFYRLITVCDDYGRMDARLPILKGRMFALKEDLRAGEIGKALAALENAGLIRTYQVKGKPYLQVLTWNDHQQIRAKVPKYPGPEEADIICNHMISDDIRCARNPIQSESNPNPNPKEDARADPSLRSGCGSRRSPDTGRTRFAPPSLSDVADYCRERGNHVDPQTFLDFYASKGWRVGNTPMKDWKAAVRTWEQREKTGGKVVSAQKYTQRDYDEQELEERLGVNELFKAAD